MASERESRRERRIRRRERKSSSSKTENTQSEHVHAGEASTFQGVDELAEMDDWGSAWQDAKDKGEGWGGRGKGGRGIQRNTWQPKDVFVEGVTLAYQGTELLERTTLRLGQGRRYGLVGANGVGKTTLLRRIAAGAVPGWPLHLRSYLVRQEELTGSPVANALETVVASDARLLRLQHEAELLEEDADGNSPATTDATNPPPPAAPRSPVPHASVMVDKLRQEISALSMEKKVARLEEVYVDLDALEAHDAEGRATSILKELGFSTTRMLQPTAELSGGWMTRVSLACALFCRPDLLLLDEPTNHMDLEGVVWLSNQLREHIGDTMVLMVSHDAGFLDAVATDIIHFQLKQLHYYPGNYSAFTKTKLDHDTAANRTQEKLDRQRKHLEDSVKAMTKAASGKGGDQKKSDQVASRMKKLGRHGHEKDANGHRWKAQTMALTGSSIRAGSANELTYRGGKTARRSLAAHVDKETVFRFPDVAPLACAMDAPIIQCRNVSFSFSGAATRARAGTRGASSTHSPKKGPRGAKAPAVKRSSGTGESGMLLEEVTLDLARSSRVVLVGRNGSGKSTLLRLIAAAAADHDVSHEADSASRSGPSAAKDKLARLEPTEGSVTRNYNARVSLFTQHHAESLRMSESPLQHMQRTFRGVEGMSEAELRRQLGCCGISGSLALQEMRSLSGGQKSRVVLAELMARRPHLLLLDEPTNHLDLPSIDALKNALLEYGGGVVLASHDQALIESLLEDVGDGTDSDAGLSRGELWEVKSHRVQRREGGLDEYLQEIAQLAEAREARRKASSRFSAQP